MKRNLTSSGRILFLNIILMLSIGITYSSAQTISHEWPLESGSYPESITIDASGNIYTANKGNSTVTKITPAGDITKIWATLATGAHPQGIAIDASGNVYTTNKDNNTISKITPAGIVTEAWATLAGDALPVGIVIDASGNVYTDNWGNGTVSKITPAGVVTEVWVTLPSDDSYAMVIDAAGNIYTSNRSRNMISKITPAGHITGAWATLADDASMSGITIDAAGNIYTSNKGNHTVSKITPAGIVTEAWATLPNSITLNDIAVDASGNVYTANYQTGSISKITPAGTTISIWASNIHPFDIAIDAAGNLYTANSVLTSISKVIPIAPDAANILYVNKNVSGGTGSGNSWANALPDLADALHYARVNTINWASDSLRIFIAKGVYYPKYRANDSALAVNDRNDAFVMVKNVQLYGGFDPGNGITDLTHRILPFSGGVDAGTILSGDIGTANNNTDNAYHVVISSEYIGNALLNGLSITGGNANGSGTAIVGGVVIDQYHSGGIYNRSSSPALINVNITGNNSNSYGGGIFNLYSSPDLTNVNISNNSAGDGGGMYNYTSSPVLTNVTIGGNNGGGVYNTSSSSPKINNSILYGNKADGVINNILNDSGTPAFSHSLIGGATAWQSVWGTDNGNNIAANTNPFVDTATGDYSLVNTSRAVDGGSNALYRSGGGDTLTDADLAGNPRVYHTTSGGRIDIGAYEYQGAPVITITPGTGNILYVDQSVSGSDGRGDSWDNAIPELADALKWARVQYDADNNWLNGDSLRIFVAKGTYKPLYSAADDSYTTDGGRDNAFVMVKNVQLYGGFDPANGIDNLSDLRILPSPVGGVGGGSLLSGDIGIPDDSTDNTYHVVIATNVSNTTLINGFTLTGGNADGDGAVYIGDNIITDYYGGGIYNSLSALTFTNVAINNNSAEYGGGGIYNTNASPILKNVAISGNTANSSGGGMHNDPGSAPILRDVSISGNSATYYGGGIYNNASNPILINVVIRNNTADLGGGMENESSSSPILRNITISGNTASTYGGGMYNYQSDPELTNVIIHHNSAAYYGGGIYNDDLAAPILTNVTICNNSADDDGGGGIANYSTASPVINNSIIYGNRSGTAINNIIDGSSSTVQYSLIEGSGGWNTNWGTDGGNNIIIATNPFADTTNGNFSLSPGFAVNGGNNALYTNAGGDLVNDTDLAGNTRVYNQVDGGRIDMGAYEYQDKIHVPGITFDNDTVTYDGNAHSIEISGTLPDDVSVSYSGNGKTDAGTYTVTAEIDGGSNYLDSTLTATLVINKDTISGITLENDTVTYNGNAHSIEISGTLPDGTSVNYDNNSYTDAGIYTITANIEGGNNYKDSTLTATLVINKDTISGITFENDTVTYNGNAHSIEVSGTLPDGTSVSYDNNSYTDAGTYTITANIEGGNNYKDSILTATLVINKDTISGITFINDNVTYDGSSHSLAIEGTLPTGASVTYTGNGKINAGTYTVTANITGGNNYKDSTMTATLTIEKAVINGITFEDATYTYDATEKSLAITGILPSGASVTYSVNDETNAGTYTVTANIDGGNNYKDLSLTATLTINKATHLEVNIVIGNLLFENPSDTVHYAQPCGSQQDEVSFNLDVQGEPLQQIVVTTPKPGVYKKHITVSSPNLEGTQEYDIVIERPFNFSDVVIQKFDNTLLVDNNPETNGGYHFIKYQWFMDGAPIGDGQVYSAGNTLNDLLNTDAEYSVILTTDNGEVIHACPVKIERRHDFAVVVYPNPIRIGGELKIEFDYPDTAFRGAKARINTLNGTPVLSATLESQNSLLQLPSRLPPGAYMLTLYINGHTQTVKLIVTE